MAKATGDLWPQASGTASLGAEMRNGGFTGALRPFANMHQNSGVFHNPINATSGIIRFKHVPIDQLDGTLSPPINTEFDGFDFSFNGGGAYDLLVGSNNNSDLRTNTGRVFLKTERDKHLTIISSGLFVHVENSFLVRSALDFEVIAPDCSIVSALDMNLQATAGPARLSANKGDILFQAGDTSSGLGGQIDLLSFGGSGVLEYRFGRHQSWYIKTSHSNTGGPFNDGYWPIAHSGNVNQMINQAIAGGASPAGNLVPDVSGLRHIGYDNGSIIRPYGSVHMNSGVFHGHIGSSGIMRYQRAANAISFGAPAFGLSFDGGKTYQLELVGNTDLSTAIASPFDDIIVIGGTNASVIAVNGSAGLIAANGQSIVLATSHVTVHSTGGDVQITSDGGDVNVDAGDVVDVFAQSNIQLASNGGNVTIISNANDIALIANLNVNLNSNNFITLSGGDTITIQSIGNSVVIVGAVDVNVTTSIGSITNTAERHFIASANNGSITLTSITSDVALNAPANINLQTTNDAGNILISTSTGSNVTLSARKQIALNPWKGSGILEYRFGPHQSWAMKTSFSSGGPAGDGFWPIPHSGNVKEMIVLGMPGNPGDVLFKNGGNGVTTDSLGFTFNDSLNMLGVSGALSLGRRSLDRTAQGPAQGSGTVQLVAINLAERPMFGASNSGVNLPYFFQPALFNKFIFMAIPSTTTTIDTYGNTLTSVGTVSHPTPEYASGVMINQVTAAGAASTAGTGSAATPFTRGALSGMNTGFFFASRIALPDTNLDAGRIFVGLAAGTMASTVGADDPGNNTCGFSFSTTQANPKTWNFSTKDASTNRKQDTGITCSGQRIFDMYIYSPPYPNNDVIYWTLHDVSWNRISNGYAINNLPVKNTMLRPGIQLSNITASARNIRYTHIYCEGL